METSLSQSAPFQSSAWASSGHLHTIVPSLLHRPKKPLVTRIEIDTQDGDFLELDVHKACEGRPVIALFHGLEGSTERYYIVELMQQLAQRNYSVVGVNFRSCGSKLNRRRRFYHSGETGDMQTVFSWINGQFPDAAMGAVGFSLGGNVLLKYMGEFSEESLLDAAVSVSVPYDLKTGSLNIGRGVNKIYEYRFLRSLTAKLKKKQQTFSDLPSFSGSTLYEFDDQVTSPIHGFNSADDYYTRCSSQQFIEPIRQPTLVIHSRQDPLCPVDDMPLQKIKENRNIDYIITDRGGHVGFWGKPKGWLNQTIVNYIRRKID